MNLAQTKRLSDYKAQNVGSRGTVLLVGDNEPFRISLAEQIDVYVGAEIVEVSTGSAFLNLIHKRHFDLIILDLSGLYFGDIGGCDSLKARCSEIPIIVLLEHVQRKNDDVEKLGSKTVEYLTKPFRLGLFLGKIKTILAHQSVDKKFKKRVGRYTFVPESKLLAEVAGAKTVRLTEKETAILEVLVSREDEVVTREVLLDRVWGYRADIRTHTLETHIYRLRKKLEHVSSGSNLLITSSGGYRLRR